MDFTREPIIESVVTPREGCKLVVRSSKGSGQEEYFVDSLEIVSFGNSFFYRSVERPKAFLMPVSEYEVVEVRETRVVLKSASPDRGSSIRIGGGRKEKEEDDKQKAEQPKAEKSRRRSSRRRRGKESAEVEVKEEPAPEVEEESSKEPEEKAEKPAKAKKKEPPEAVVSSLLPPPKELIRDKMDRYREDEQFAQAFFSDDNPPEEGDELAEPVSPAGEPITEENELPFGEGDGLERESGEKENSNSDSFLPDESHWIIPELPETASEESSEEISQKE